MAKKDKDTSLEKQSKGVSDIAAGIQNIMDGLYSKTYFTTPKLGKDLANLSDDIGRNIDRISNNNIDSVGVPNISKLYSRIGMIDRQNDRNLVDQLEDVFNDNTLMDSVLSAYMQNKYLKDLDAEIDTVCKYMPKLLEALDTRKDNVLSADHFSKDYLNVINKSVKDNEAQFNERINEIKKKYDLINKVEEIYDDAARYGEKFVYIVPYAKALNKLLASKPLTTLATAQVENGMIIQEGAQPFIMDKYDTGVDDEYAITKDETFHLNIEICTSNIVESLVNSTKLAKSKYAKVLSESVNNMSPITEAKLDKKIIDDDLEFESIAGIQGSDGFIDTKAKDPIKDTFPGCIIKYLDRSQVIPIYIEDLCMGYYYLEFKDQTDIFNYSNALSDPLVNMKSGSKLHALVDDVKKDHMIKYISGQLSKYIDAKFINNNQDLRKEIYMILKHNDLFNCPQSESVKVTFIPPDDMLHVTFKKDPNTHRGISDLEKALIPAKLYSSLYVTNTLAVLTRGQDKRVYYVKQSVDTNISKVLMNTINQIKKSNFNIRQIENINNVLNITGRFNDYIIPRGPSGESPIDFEVMQGQNVDIKTDLMTILEEMAINSTDVPLELIQARQSIDYAVQLTMTNSKFLRKVYNRQAKYQAFLSFLMTKLYNGEYNTEDELEVMLPPPMFLNITNTNQVITNTKEYVSSILEDELSDETDEEFKAIYKRDLLQFHLGSYIDTAKHEEIKDRARIKAAIKRSEAPKQGSEE